MVEFDKGRSDIDFYQDEFESRAVSATKHGVQDVVEEIEWYEEEIDGVPWSDFSQEQRLSIAVPVLGNIELTFTTAFTNGKIGCREHSRIVVQFSYKLMGEVLLVEDDLSASGMEMVKMNIDGVIDNG